MTLLHKLAHKLGWYSGHVVSRTDAAGDIYIGFMCSKCCKVMSEHCASAIIDRHIDAHLKHKLANEPAGGKREM